VSRRVGMDGLMSSSEKEKFIQELDSNLLTLSDVCFIYSFSLALRILIGTRTFTLPFSRMHTTGGAEEIKECLE